MSFKGIDYYKIDDLPSDDEKMLRSLTREFLEEEVETFIVNAWDWEEPLNMWELAPRMGGLGLLGVTLPEKYGCPEVSYVASGLICQEFERVDSALRSFKEVISGLVMYPIWQFGSGEQKDKWLPLLAKGEKIGCFGLTEPNRGSDVASMETVARRDSNRWIINGTKQWISEALPLGILQTPEDIDKAIAFIVSDDAKCITGQILNIASGSTTNH